MLLVILLVYGIQLICLRIAPPLQPHLLEIFHTFQEFFWREVYQSFIAFNLSSIVHSNLSQKQVTPRENLIIIHESLMNLQEEITEKLNLYGWMRYLGNYAHLARVNKVMVVAFD